MRLNRPFSLSPAARWAGLALLASSLLPLSAQAANVVTKVQSLGTVSVPSAQQYGNTFVLPMVGFDAAVDTFYDDYTFTVAESSFSSLTATIDLGQVFSISNLQVRLYEGTPGNVTLLLDRWATPIGTGANAVVINPRTLDAGNYVLEVRGNVTGTFGGSYTGAMNFASVSAVPEGDGLAFAAAGLSALLMLRARKQTKH